jgi:hypothetical protein
MAKKDNKSAAIKAALTPEEFQKLTPEEQAAYLAAAFEAQSENQTLKTSIAAELKKNSPVSFEIEEDVENDIEGGTYEFTCPTFTWDDNSVINVRELSASKDEKDKKKYEEICAELVYRKSGIVRRKEA